MFVASLRYSLGLRLRIEEISPTEADAARAAANLTALLGIFKSIQQGPSRNTADAAFHEMIDSLKIEQHKDRAVLTADIPTELLHQLAAPDLQTSPATTLDAPAQAAPASH